MTQVNQNSIFFFIYPCAESSWSSDNTQSSFQSSATSPFVTNATSLEPEDKDEVPYTIDDILTSLNASSTLLTGNEDDVSTGTSGMTPFTEIASSSSSSVPADTDSTDGGGDSSGSADQYENSVDAVESDDVEDAEILG
jgi:hypothetical protein